MYKLKLTRREKTELAWGKIIVSALAVMGLLAIVWLAWVRPAQQAAKVNSFASCKASGNRIQQSYPEVCLTSDGKRFVEPVQDKSHQASLAGEVELVAPNDPALLRLDVPEWNVRIPLSEKTFDLTYVYAEDGLNDRIKFSYKRLINEGICAGDIGLTLSRMVTQRMPPYTAENPAPIANIDTYYYYASSTTTPCYDPKNAEQTAHVQKIAGEQSLVQVTADLLSKMQGLPKQ